MKLRPFWVLKPLHRSLSQPEWDQWGHNRLTRGPQFWIWYRRNAVLYCLNKQTQGTQEMVRTGNPNERAKERFFIFTKTAPIVIFIFYFKMIWKWSNVPKCTKIARKVHVFFRKLLKIENVAQKLPSRICHGLVICHYALSISGRFRQFYFFAKFWLA